MRLTIMSEIEPIKWCLLHMEILVNNFDVSKGEPLVHPLQLNLLHRIVQEKMDNSERVR